MDSVQEAHQPAGSRMQSTTKGFWRWSLRLLAREVIRRALRRIILVGGHPLGVQYQMVVQDLAVFTFLYRDLPPAFPLLTPFWFPPRYYYLLVKSLDCWLQSQYTEPGRSFMPFPPLSSSFFGAGSLADNCKKAYNFCLHGNIINILHTGYLCIIFA